MEASFKRASDVVATLFNRRPGGEDTHTLVVPEPALPREWPEKLPFRKRPKPFSRAIPWIPKSSGAPHADDRPFELFVSQTVLGEVRNHLITATSGEPFGFLIGQVVYCPWAEVPYVVIDTVRRETQNLPPSNEMDRFRHAWVAASREARHRRGEVIGWYHRHGVLGLRLSEWDLQLQEEFFAEPWHCALVIAHSSRGIIGGFIQRSRRARLFRKGLAPFHELVELDAKLVDGLKPSVVDWENYGAGESVNVIRAKWPSPSTRLKKWKARRHGGEATLPTQGGSVAPGRGARQGGSLGGRSWRPDRSAEVSKPPVAASVTEDDFATAVGPAEADVVFESEEVPEPEVKAPTRRKRGKKASGKTTTDAKKKPAGESKTADPSDAGDSAEDQKTVGPGGAWYSSDFLDAVWGPPPFESEEDEPASVDELRAEESAGGTDASADEGERAAFELVPTYEPEPPEIDPPGSMDWLLGLIGETLAARQESGQTVSDPDDDAPETEESVEEEAVSTTEEQAEEEAAVPVEAGGEAPEDDDVEDASPRHPHPTRAPITMPTASPSRRPTFVEASHNPDHDPEAQIPIVLFDDGEKWQPSPQQKRVGGVVLAVIALTIIVQLVRGSFSADAPAPVPPPAAAVDPSPASPTSEFPGLL
ncbi:MAG: hypothetical protein ACC682_14960, partial [Gemmatimonadota bacterium]